MADFYIDTADSSDDVASAEAIAKGLKEGHTAEKPGYWIHVSGTAILCWYDARNERYGEAPLPEQAYNDVTSIEKLRNLPDDAFHRNVDKIVQASNTDAVRTAIVCPPTIYGSGRGAVNTRSMQVPNLAKAALEKGFVPIVGAGKTEWDHVHVDDLGEMMSQLAGASQDSSKRDDREIFGPNGYFFVENGTHKWGEVAKWVAAEASRQGYLPEALTKTVSRTEVDNTSLAGAPTWSINSKGKAQRAKERLGWKATGVSLRDTIGEIVKVEAKALGLTPKE